MTEAEQTTTHGATSAVTPTIADHVVDTIARHCDPSKIIVFGSTAAGHAGAASDLDLLVVMESALPRHRRAAPIRLLFSPYPCPMDILVYTPAEIRKWYGTANHIVTEAMDTGETVYERA